MPRIQKRKYEKIEQAEIDLVVQCNDSHEFYERYREEFPTRKKGIDSISKIWKRRGEFIKKQLGPGQPDVAFAGSTQELEQIMAVQTRILSELSGMMKEQVKISKEILTHLQKPVMKVEDHTHKVPAEKPSEKPAEQKEPQKKPGHEKQRADIMVGS
jgi:uncharacterized coiled-coil protein SlyX